MSGANTRAAYRLVKRLKDTEISEGGQGQAFSYLARLRDEVSLIVKNIPDIAAPVSAMLTKNKKTPIDFDLIAYRATGKAEEASILWTAFIVAGLEHAGSLTFDEVAIPCMQLLSAWGFLERAVGTRRVKLLSARHASAAGVKAKRETLSKKREKVIEVHSQLLAEGQGRWGMNRRIAEMTGVHEKTVSRILNAK